MYTNTQCFTSSTVSWITEFLIYRWDLILKIISVLTNRKQYIKRYNGWITTQLTCLLCLSESTKQSTPLAHCSHMTIFNKSIVHIFGEDNNIFYILLTVHPEAIVGFQPTWLTFSLFTMYLFFHLYMFQATSTHHKEGTIVSTHPLA
jgi:hypothetical protein